MGRKDGTMINHVKPFIGKYVTMHLNDESTIPAIYLLSVTDGVLLYQDLKKNSYKIKIREIKYLESYLLFPGCTQVGL